MRKRRVYAVVIGIALVGLLVWALGREREPEYGGKRLSEWVEQYVTPPRMNLLRNKEQAADAIRHIGTNARPSLLSWIRYETPPWKSKMYEVVNSISIRLNLEWQFFENKAVRADNARRSFWAVGREAEESIPELNRILTDGKEQSVYRAANILARGGIPCWSPLLGVLTNRQSESWRRVIVAYQIHGQGTNARPAIPALEGLLTDPDQGLRNFATNALREINPAAWEKMGKNGE